MKFLPVCLLAFLWAASFIQADEVINGQFTEGLKGWMIQREGQPSLAAKEATPFYLMGDEGGAVINVAAIGTANGEKRPSSVILTQYLKALQEGSDYTLTFEAKIPASQKVIYGLGIGVQGGPNKSNLGGAVPLTELTGTGDWMPVSASFRWDPSGPTAYAKDNDVGPTTLQFRIGLLNEFGIRNVVLEP